AGRPEAAMSKGKKETAICHVIPSRVVRFALRIESRSRGTCFFSRSFQVAEFQPNVSLFLQPLSAQPLQPRIRRIQRLFHHVLNRIVEALLLEPYAMCEITKYIHIRPAFPKRFNRLTRNLQVIMPVRSLQFLVLEKSRGRENNIGVIR